MDPKPVQLDTTKLAPKQEEPQATAGPPNQDGAANSAEVLDRSAIEEKIIAALRTCFDPEIPVNIYELGLIYQVEIDDSGAVKIRMTLTSPGCPVAGTLPREVEAKVASVPGVTRAQAEVVWDPPWNKNMMSEAAMLELGMF